MAIPRSSACLAAAAALLLAACDGGSDDSATERAEAKVTAKQEAVSEAQSGAADATASFCEAGQTYIIALDRYGDLISSTAPTVGDVKDAGADLTEPGEEVIKEAEAAVTAREELKAAEQELADARAELAEVQSSAGGSGSTPSESGSESSATIPPMPPAETVNRVKHAGSEFTSAQEGISEQTPLVQASQQFNAAAVALEMAWLQLYGAAGCLTDDQQQQAEAAVADYTMALQQSLSEAGFYQEPVDGVYGPETVNAVEALQRAHGLPVTGTVDKATAAALEGELQEQGGAAAQDALASTAALQQTLKLAGFWDGPVDGSWTPELSEALKSFQSELGIEPTGAVDAATVAAVERAIADAQRPDQPSPSDSESPTAPAASTTST